MGVFDSLLMLRTTGALTQDESVGPVTVYGGQRHGLSARIIVPSAFGDNDSIKANVYTSTDNSTYNLVASSIVKKPGAGVGADLIVPFSAAPGKTYVKVELDVTIASTTAAFGTVMVGLVDDIGFQQDRSAGYQYR